MMKKELNMRIAQNVVTKGSTELPLSPTHMLWMLWQVSDSHHTPIGGCYSLPFKRNIEIKKIENRNLKNIKMKMLSYWKVNS